MKRWIAAAIKKPGALTKSAKKAGESPMEYAKEHADATGVTGQRSRLAMTLMKLNKK